jgi:adenylosuccinate lyase
MSEDFDLVSKLSPEQKAIANFRLDAISPNDGKYGKKVDGLRKYISPRAEWLACLKIQGILMEVRQEFGKATEEQVQQVKAAIENADPLNIALLEDDKRIQHDQLAVIEELGRHLPVGTKALLHPGTTSYDILDTARAYLFKEAWLKVIRPEAHKAINKLCDLAEENLDVIQVGRTHLQYTSPVTYGLTLSRYARRLAERVTLAGYAFSDLKGKISGIVGTGAGIEAVFGEGNAMDVESAVLKKLGLEPDYAATQVTPKEKYADVGHALTTLMKVLANFAEDTRQLYSTDIQEIATKEKRSGGSSTDATKDNPINWENIAGNDAVVESGMRILYEMIKTDFERDLRSSKQARHEPQAMMAETYESLVRFNSALDKLWVNKEKMLEHLDYVRENPGDAMTTILKGAGWTHSQYGDPHTFVKNMSLKAKIEGKSLLNAREDDEFARAFLKLPEKHQKILSGEIELYLGDAKKRTLLNIEYARILAPISSPS